MSTFHSFCRVAALLLPAAYSHAQIMSYPAKPVRSIVATPPGGPYDETARAIGPRLTAIWGQQVIVDNRPGAANIIGATTAAKSPPDGYTFFLANVASQAITPALRKNLPYDPQRDFAPVTLMLSSPLVIVVHPSMPAKTIRDLVNLARARPGSLNYASAGVGNLQHLAMEMLQSAATIRMNHVPYKGSAQASVDLIAGHVDLMFANITAQIVEFHVTNKMRMIGVTSPERIELTPEIPTINEQGLRGFASQSFFGIYAPTKTPAAIVERINSVTNEALADRSFSEKLLKAGYETRRGLTPTQSMSYMKEEIDKWRPIMASIEQKKE
jgi:tripartite-type tricarboxylate transporter receptor subunit TctC